MLRRITSKTITNTQRFFSSSNFEKNVKKYNIFGAGAIEAAENGEIATLQKYLDTNTLVASDLRRLGIPNILEKNGFSKVGKSLIETLSNLDNDSSKVDIDTCCIANETITTELAKMYQPDIDKDLLKFYNTEEIKIMSAVQAGYGAIAVSLIDNYPGDIGGLNLPTLAEVHGHYDLSKELRDIVAQRCIEALKVMSNK